jgi:hypothetical protein
MGGWSKNTAAHRSARKSRQSARADAENKKRLARLEEIEAEKRGPTTRPDFLYPVRKVEPGEVA